MGLTDERSRRREATLRNRPRYSGALSSVSEPAADGSFWAADVAEYEKGGWFAHHFPGNAEPSACGRYRAAPELLEDIPGFIALDSPLVCAGCLRRLRRHLKPDGSATT